MRLIEPIIAALIPWLIGTFLGSLEALQFVTPAYWYSGWRIVAGIASILLFCISWNNPLYPKSPKTGEGA